MIVLLKTVEVLEIVAEESVLVDSVVGVEDALVKLAVVDDGVDVVRMELVAEVVTLDEDVEVEVVLVVELDVVTVLVVEDRAVEVELLLVDDDEVILTSLAPRIPVLPTAAPRLLFM